MLGIVTTASESTTLPFFDFFRSANEWSRQSATWIWQNQSSWKYDDSKYTDFPEATTALVNDQQDYSLPTTAQKIERVEVLDKDGNYQLVNPTTREWIKDYSMSEYYETAGMPAYYILEGNSILLYPKPATGYVTMLLGLKVYFSRNITAFSITDTSTKPGFSENFHRIISVGAALDYAQSKQMTNIIPILMNKLSVLKFDLQEFYSSRHPAIKSQFRVFREETI